ncbi:MAG: amidophosphoribosyltransferase [Acidaminococcus provencensis]|jgi:amidophosphoribosyltransferase|uniref:amidophosphoribosyltransferase n=1 Tax=Acidaminococcus provencensis TaxID=2058289 RepID=UPI0023F4428F|nr:amidophosphoribosyltransferase [Acidaminococcus provencensis]MCH4095122.1 amidophosphoribosyltransferase [Acidaminococcus provencensis]
MTERDFAEDKLHEECGVFGIYSKKDDVALNTYWGLFALQHRGQESAGIAVSDGRHMHIKKAMGLVNDVFKDGVRGLDGYMAIGHVRYSTTGSSIPYNVQPLKVFYDGGNLALSHNGNLTNAAQLRSQLAKEGTMFQTTVDSEVVLSLITRSRKATLPERVAEAANTIKGAFSILIMNDEQLIAFRDPYGFRPLCLGRLDKGWVVASETCALDLVGAKYVRDLEAGEMIVIDDENAEPKSIMYSTHKPEHLAHCVFEYVYFARPDSIMDGESIYQARINMGRQLARETKNIKADIVISVPDSGTPAAIGYGLEAGIPFVEGLTKNKYIGRTFIQPTQKQRLNAVRLKLNANRSLVAGKSVVMVDDSIVRGTTSGKIVQLLRDAGATAVHVCISSPPVMDSCYYGIDTSERKELIAASKTEEEIREYIKADSLHYISMEGLRSSLSVLNPDDMCYACFNAKYPDGADKEMELGSKFQFETSC